MAKKNKSKKPTVKDRKKELDKKVNKVDISKEKQTVVEKMTKEEKKIEKKRKKENKKAEKDKKKRDKKAERLIVGKGTMKQELKKVTWPTALELTKSTSAVIFIVVLTAIIIFLSDLLFGTLNKEFSKQVKQRNQRLEENIENEANNNDEKDDETNDEKEIDEDKVEEQES